MWKSKLGNILKIGMMLLEVTSTAGYRFPVFPVYNVEWSRTHVLTPWKQNGKDVRNRKNSILGHHVFFEIFRRRWIPSTMFYKVWAQFSSPKIVWTPKYETKFGTILKTAFTISADIHYIVFMFKLKLQSCGLIKSALLGTLQLGGKHILTSSLSTRKVEISNNIFVATSCIYLLHDRASLLRGKFTKKTNKT